VKKARPRRAKVQIQMIQFKTLHELYIKDFSPLRLRPPKLTTYFSTYFLSRKNFSLFSRLSGAKMNAASIKIHHERAEIKDKEEV
jgi:hypothetical protein